MQFADDVLPFYQGEGRVELVRLRNESRLRPPSAEFFGRNPFQRSALDWPAQNLELASIFFLEPVERLDVSCQLIRVSGSDTYRLLLEQAFTLSLADTRVRSQLMEDYLFLAANVPVHRLLYRPDLASLDRVLDMVVEVAKIDDAAEAQVTPQGQ